MFTVAQMRSLRLLQIVLSHVRTEPLRRTRVAKGWENPRNPTQKLCRRARKTASKVRICAKAAHAVHSALRPIDYMP